MSLLVGSTSQPEPTIHPPGLRVSRDTSPVMVPSPAMVHLMLKYLCGSGRQLVNNAMGLSP